ncbi:MAG: cysteine hydrolase family protein [Gemmatimonadota bacterium]
MNWDTAALILIDFQQGMDDPSLGPRNNPDAECNAARMLAEWRRAGRPLIHVQHMSTESNSVFRPGRAGNALKPIVAPQPGETLIQKTVSSAFIGTDLEQRLRSAGIDTLIFAGMQTDLCVSSTARMAGNLGFTVYVVNDATATFDRPGVGGQVYSAALVHDVTLASLHNEFATVVMTSDILPPVAAEPASHGS